MITRMALFATVILTLGAGSVMAVPAIYPDTLLDNTTGAPDSTFLGAPNDVFYGLGGQQVTYDFGVFRVVDGAGQDFNVYEVDYGVAEFKLVDVLVSLDAINFFSVKSSESAAMVLDGDEAHGGKKYARSYDLGPSGLAEVRYIRIDGSGTDSAGEITGFDLDAIGAVNFRDASLDEVEIETLPEHTALNPEPVTAALGLLGLGALGASLRRRRA